MAAFMFFFFNDTATTEIYTLSLHDALPISKTWSAPHPLLLKQQNDQDRGDDKAPNPGPAAHIGRTVAHSQRVEAQDGQVGYFVFQLFIANGQRVVALEEPGKTGVLEHLAGDQPFFIRIAYLIHARIESPAWKHDLDLGIGVQIPVPVRTLTPPRNTIDIAFVDGVIDRHIANLARLPANRFQHRDIAGERVAKNGPKPKPEHGHHEIFVNDAENSAEKI